MRKKKDTQRTNNTTNTSKEDKETQSINCQGEMNKTNGFCEIGPRTNAQRRSDAFQIRENAARDNKHRPLNSQSCNNDEAEFCNNFAGNYTKALPHDAQTGLVDPEQYRRLLEALSTGNPQLFNQIQVPNPMKLANPQASYAFDLFGPDPHQPTIPAAPSFTSAEAAAEMVELYWQALTKDVHFLDYPTSRLINAAVQELNTLNDYTGPKPVTPQNIFRGNTPGDLVGPYISQFFFFDVPYGALGPLPQQYNVPLPGKQNDFMTKFDEWLNIQNGELPTRSIAFDPLKRYLRNGRDLGSVVSIDFIYQLMLSAALILLGDTDRFGPRAIASSNPYSTFQPSSRTQGGFVTFGQSHILDFVAKSSRNALEAVWYQKWLVHRRLRPEEFGGILETNRRGTTDIPINNQLTNSQALRLSREQFETNLLPQGAPQGSPTHPSYPAGHAIIAGAAVTMLKAFFNEDLIIENPVQASRDGLSLIPINDTLTVGGELNKLAQNISIGRDWLGFHYRTDATAGLALGEEMAIGILQDYLPTYNEANPASGEPIFEGFVLTKFDGTTINIGC